jgi:steroid delta-isomerase-like uncharacterized protein
MPQANLIDISRELIDAFNAADGQRFKKHIVGDALYDEIGTQRKIHGADAWVQTWEQWRRALPDVKGTVTNAIASGNTVVLEIRWEGTQTGALEMPGSSIPASGKRMITRASMIFGFDGEKVKECRHYFDMLSLLQQIGAAPQQTSVSGR